MIETQENGGKPYFGPDLNQLRPNSGRQFFFSKIWFCESLDIMVSYHHAKHQKRLKIQPRENLVTYGQRDGRE